MMITVLSQNSLYCCRIEVYLLTISTTSPPCLDHFWWLAYRYSFPVFVVGCKFIYRPSQQHYHFWWLPYCYSFSLFVVGCKLIYRPSQQHDRLTLTTIKIMTTRWPSSPTLPAETIPSVIKLHMWLSTEETVVDRDWMIEASTMIDSWQPKKMKRKLLGSFNQRIR